MSQMRFGAFVFDPATGELSTRGRQTALRPQAARVLRYLAERRGTLVTREELNRELWSEGTYVDFGHGLTLCIYEIRAALGDDPSAPTYVETLPRRGYRFVAPVETEPPAGAPETSLQEPAPLPEPERARPAGRWRVSGVPGALAAGLALLLAVGTIVIVSGRSSEHDAAASSPAEEPRAVSVALLPLTDIANRENEAYFADGITWELQRQLERVQTLRVLAGGSVLPYKGSNKSGAEIGRALKVENVVSGSVLQLGDRIRLNVKLLDTKTGAPVWAQSYDTTLADLLETELEVARAVGRALDRRVVRSAPHRTPGAKKQVSAEAHALLLRAMAAETTEAYQRGLEQAAAIDPELALAWSLLADSQLSDTWFAQTNAPMVGYPKAKDLALKALALDASDSNARTTLAAVKLHHEWDWAGAEREFRKAIELSPSDAWAHHIYSHYLLTMDRLSESVAESRIASGLNPLDANLSTCVGWHCLYARQYDDAIAECMKLINDRKAGGITYYYLGRVYVRQGKLEEGIAALEIAEKKSGGINSVLATLAYAYGRAGRRADAERALAVLMDRAQRRYVAAFDIAIVHAGLGETDATFEWLERAFLERSTWLVHLKWDDRFTGVRTDPRLVTLLRRMGIPNPESVRAAEVAPTERYIDHAGPAPGPAR